jgi:multiple sugar transport system permease protein
MSRFWKIAMFVVLTLVLVSMLFPFIYMVVDSFRPPTSPLSFSLQNYFSILTRGGLGRFLFNSAFIAVIVTVGNLLFCLMAGYALARRRFFGDRFLFISATAVLMIPAHVVIIPVFILISKMGLYNSYWALILPFLVNPLGIFLMTQYIKNLPDDCEQAARIDGAGEFTILFKIVAPLCKPALAVLAVQAFLSNWNSFVYPFILVSSPKLYTLPVGLAMIQGMQGMSTPELMAGSTIATLPVVIVFLIFQRQITEGITAGAVKG